MKHGPRTGTSNAGNSCLSTMSNHLRHMHFTYVGGSDRPSGPGKTRIPTFYRASPKPTDKGPDQSKETEKKKQKRKGKGKATENEAMINQSPFRRIIGRSAPFSNRSCLSSPLQCALSAARLPLTKSGTRPIFLIPLDSIGILVYAVFPFSLVDPIASPT